MATSSDIVVFVYVGSLLCTLGISFLSNLNVHKVIMTSDILCVYGTTPDVKYIIN